MASYFLPVLGLLCILRYTIQGAGYTNLAMLSGVSEMIARTAVSLWAVPALGYIAVCFGDPTAWIARPTSSSSPPSSTSTDGSNA